MKLSGLFRENQFSHVHDQTCVEKNKSSHLVDWAENWGRRGKMRQVKLQTKWEL